jgi:hypothetical protein
MCDHGHSGHGNGSCASESVNFDHGDAEQQYNMCAFIDKEKVNVLNEEIEGSGVEVFKIWSDRMDK